MLLNDAPVLGGTGLPFKRIVADLGYLPTSPATLATKASTQKFPCGPTSGDPAALRQLPAYFPRTGFLSIFSSG